MPTSLFLGSLFGFVSAIPVAGPVSAIIFSRGLRGKYTQGRWIACGTGLAEGAYVFLAFWGFTHFLADLSFMFILSKLLAAIILGALGIYFFKSQKLRNPISSPTEDTSKEHHAFLIGAGVSFANPTLIATWTAAATTLYSMKLFNYSTLNCALFAGGVGVGIIAWFSLMMSLMDHHLDRLNKKALDRGLKIMGIGLTGIALFMLISAIRIWLT